MPPENEGSPGGFDFDNLAREHRDVLGQRTRRRSRLPLWVTIGALVALAVALVAAVVLRQRQPSSIALKPVDDQLVDELDSLEFTVAIRHADKVRDPLEFTLDGAPEGARIDAATGKFTWKPGESQGQGSYPMTVHVRVPGREGLSAQQDFTVHVREVRQPPALEPIDEQTVPLGGSLTFEVRATDRDLPAKPLRFRLVPGAASGARIDPATGLFQWTPQNAAPDDVYEITVEARAAVRSSPVAQTTFRVRIEAPGGLAGQDPDLAIDRFLDELRKEELEVATSDDPLPHPPLAGKPRWLSINGQPVAMFGYGSADEAERDVKLLTPEDLEASLQSGPAPASAYLFHRDCLIAFYAGGDATLLNLLDRHLGRPAVRKTIGAKPPVEPAPDPAAKPSAELAGDEIILKLYRKHKLLSKTEYPTLRTVYAERFESEHQDEIRQAFGEEGDLRKWLDEHVDIKEEFYLAIDPEHDNVEQVLALFQELFDRFPQQFESYAGLAIAVAVVWDDERRAIHRSPSGQHQSTMPEGGLGAMENFRYLLDAENVMQGRTRFLPWEFLVHLVNHRTPWAERHWAVANYLPKRVMIGKCYNDVPYDGGMRDGMERKLKGKLHTLPNLRQLGGVCSARADYAGRVAKCIGVPAFSVSGKSRFGESHAWVMWVELGTVTRTGFTFSLESHGRFRNDRYYVGHLNDPHTGLRVTDRDLERRLHTVGMDPIGKRHADLVMRSYPMLRDGAEMDVAEQLRFLTRLLDLSPGNEPAWIALARISREGQITKANSKPMTLVLERLFVTFAALPDFTWVVFDDLVSFQDIPEKRAALFGRLAAMYEQAGRPDLACQARLKYAEYLVADQRLEEAIQGLTASILLFPEEGNFVPGMLDRMEELCGQVAGGQGHLARFYQQFLPKIPQKRGKRPSPYCLKMYQRGIEVFNKAGLYPLAQLYETQLAMLKASLEAQK